MHLVIVESPTKAKTIGAYLGKSYKVVSSFGHIRDLPRSKLGVDVEHGFLPHYVVPRDKQKVVTELKALAKKTDDILFATDEDREGEAISWHLAAVLDVPEKKVKRLVFHEITKTAITEALKNARPLNMDMVDAQQARRIVDRLVGYELSPFLWKKIARGLSAGRVQSVAVRLIVEREREREAFKPESYWVIKGLFHPSARVDAEFEAKLHAIQGKTIDKLDINTAAYADKIVSASKKSAFTLSDIEEKKQTRSPSAPFTTSTLQQEANRRLGYSAKQTMMLAQRLYEGVSVPGEGTVGLITYMRTDSVNLSQEFVNRAREHVETVYGKEFVPSTPKKYITKSKLAQEAHEAIRPTHVHITPEKLGDKLESKLVRLYTLIWQRAIASQMADARLTQTSLEISTTTPPEQYTFKALGSIVDFAGFSAVFPLSTKESLLPAITKGETMTAKEITSEGKQTEPAARYNDATLVKALEEYDIGRPSTYAPTISTIIARGYVIRDEDRRLAPTDIAKLVNDVLVEHFPRVVDFKFTAQMENDLDEIAAGNKKWQPIVKDFYEPFKKNLTEKQEVLSKKELTEETTTEICDKCGKPMIIKTGRFGRFMACSGYPECKNTKPLPGTEGDLPADKRGRFGKFWSCSRYPECKFIKKIQKTIGVKCPQCKEGDIVMKRSKRGRTFYACNRYPACKLALWGKPTGSPCTVCDASLVYGAKDTIQCSNKECPSKKKSK
ncbi:MAG: topoisomerase I protein [Candidatus Magasanikbacteria bacterium GW2011_GWC2_45_8]|uniref:DNA topoisomerase 1 n=1 Tax=Candidatus Magasanikbacteria bacterium GW2011_GWC2_45_8 TaxID=1619050 RepID=A0A0G1MZC3_9BACT|nr:MAG: topoisomerase I protein [Candidatus Magasanikbacteria bacterium GW2011_GWC2_45_8]